MSDQPAPVKVVKVSLPEYKTGKTSRNWSGEPKHEKYRVILHLSRPLSGYEMNAFGENTDNDVQVSRIDPDQLEIGYTTLEEVRGRIPDIEKDLDVAVMVGAENEETVTRANETAQASAKAEAERRQALLDEINRSLGDS